MCIFKVEPFDLLFKFLVEVYPIYRMFYAFIYRYIIYIALTFSGELGLFGFSCLYLKEKESPSKKKKKKKEKENRFHPVLYI